MLRPVYWQGPPVASQTWSMSILVSRARSVLANFRLIRSSPATRSRKVPTTAVIASIPPRRSYSESAMESHLHNGRCPKGMRDSLPQSDIARLRSHVNRQLGVEHIDKGDLA